MKRFHAQIVTALCLTLGTATLHAEMIQPELLTTQSNFKAVKKANNAEAKKNVKQAQERAREQREAAREALPKLK